jgi:UDP-N-acetylmuramyl tripeptide synthase
VLVTGTNGKTTTARLLGSILRAAGHDPIRNSAGSNLMRGVAAALLDEAGALGSLPGSRPAVFEIDEATLHEAARAIGPDVIVFTNLFRDQLDRYGEIDSVAGVWRRTLAGMPPTSTIVLNADDPLVAGLRADFGGRVLTYGIDDRSAGLGEAEHAADSRWCPRCERDYSYDALFFGHIGWWRCPGCGDARPEPDVRACDIELLADDAARFVLLTRDGRETIDLPLAGLYNVDNALAAVAAAAAMDVPLAAIKRGLVSVTAAFGRQERLTIGGTEVRVLLGKNPAGLNQALRTIALASGEKDIVFALNDDIADGTDVSWIWDVDYELLNGHTRRVVATGRRAEDMALRLKYAGFDGVAVEGDIPTALRAALAEAGGTLYVLPTYTALLEAREALGRWASAGHFWERAS